MSKEGLTPAPGDSPGSTTPQTTPSPLPVAPSDVLPTPADLFPGYEIVAEISRGGQGIVYQAVQQATKRKVAIKVLLHGHFADPSSKARFQREIETLAQLHHPNIVSIYTAEQTKDGRQFYVMDYVRGRRLDEYVQSQRCAVDQIVKLFIDVCEAMHYAHEHGFVHRDLKPQNILVDSDGRAHILDFGLARPVAAGVDPQLSVSTHVMGTLRYLSPEQAGRDPAAIDRRTDVYALGVILYTLLTGTGPYDTDSDLHSALDNILHAVPKRPSLIQKGIDRDLETILLTCLAKERDRRYQTAAALASDLRAYLAGSPISAKLDSKGYAVRKHARRAVQRYPISTHLAIIAAAATLAILIGNPLVNRWTKISQPIDRALMNQLSAARLGPALQQVRVIGLPSDTDIVALAKRDSLADVTPKDRKSLRRLHGKLMERLAHVGVKAVAFDIDFPTETKFDEDFVRGAKALSEAGVVVLVGVTEWPLHGLSAEQLSPTIARDVLWGRPAAVLSAELPWRLVLFMQRGLAEPLPSLALVTLTASHQPNAEPKFSVDDLGEALNVIYYRADPNLSRSKTKLEFWDHIKLTDLMPIYTDLPQKGLQPGDILGYFVTPMPSGDVLGSSTIEYSKVFSATDDELEDMLRGKVVVIGNLNETARHPDGRKLAACYAHAVGIEMLLRSISIERPHLLARSTLTASGGLLGCLIAMYASRRRWKAYLFVAAAVVAVFGASFVLARFANVVWIPLVQLLAMAIACEMSLWIRRRNEFESRTQS